jgi:ATP-dependent Zn protease
MFDKISTGALNDLEKVTRQARAIVSIYGLNDRIGNLTYYDSTGQSDYNFTKPYSEKTAQAIDEEISKIIEKQYKRAVKLLEDNKSKLILLAELLFEKEVIFEKDLKKIFGKRSFHIDTLEEEYKKEVKDTKDSDNEISEEISK